jgi:hypothetical protein
LPPGVQDAGQDAASDAGADASSTGGAGGTAGSGGAGGSGATGGSGGSGGTPCDPPLGGECDVIPQCGCSLGEKCALTDISTNVTTGCVPAGNAQPQGTCNFAGGCSAGHECFNGVCTPFCNTDSDCPDHENGSKCVPMVVYGETVPGIFACAAACNPLTSSSCGPGAACSLVYTGGEIVSRCQQEGSKSMYSSCGSWFDCTAGTWCAGGFCLKWCRIGMNDCPGSTTCYEYTIQGNPIVYQGQTWGACG